jgi:cation transport ATPase
VVEALHRMGIEVAMITGDNRTTAASVAALSGLDRVLAERLGSAIGTGADVAIEASDITLVRGDLEVVPLAIRLSRRTYSTIVENLIWAFGYNVAAIPLAAFGLLNPLIAGGATALSSPSVLSKLAPVAAVSRVTGTVEEERSAEDERRCEAR